MPATIDVRRFSVAEWHCLRLAWSSRSRAAMVGSSWFFRLHYDQSIYIFIDLSVRLSVCPSVCQSVCLTVCLSSPPQELENAVPQITSFPLGWPAAAGADCPCLELREQLIAIGRGRRGPLCRRGGALYRRRIAFQRWRFALRHWPRLRVPCVLSSAQLRGRTSSAQSRSVSGKPGHWDDYVFFQYVI